MIKRLKILLLLQLSNQSRVVEKHSKRIYRYIALRVLMIVVLSIVIGLLLHVIKNIIYIPVNEYFLISFLFFTQIIQIISSLISLSTDIYQSKDNQILLTLPAKNDEIFYAKILLYYWQEFKKNLFLLLPFLIGYGFISSMGIFYYINVILMMIILPFISVFIASLFSTLFTFIGSYVKKHAWLSFTLMISAIILLFMLVYFLVGMIPPHIRIVELYHSFIVSLTKFLQTVATYATIYASIGKLMVGINVFFTYLITIGVIILLSLLNYFISRPLFFYLTSKTSEQVRVKEHYVRKDKKHHLFWTFFRKEWLIAKRSPNEILSNYGVILFLPIIMYALNTIYMSMNRSSFGNILVIIFNIFIILLLIITASAASSVAITTEGYEFILLKTSPSKSKMIAWAKMTFNFILTSILLLISFILFRIALPTFDQALIIYLFIFVFFFNGAQILMSFQIDILHPKLSEYAQTGSLSHISNISQALTKGFFVAIIFTLLSIITLLIMPDIAWIILISISVLWFLFRLKSFYNYVDAYFADIEY